MEVVCWLVFWKKSRRGKAVGQTKIGGADTLDKVIYYEGMQEVVSPFHELLYISCIDILHAQIGTISHIYDSPSMGLSYLQGYQYHLALIIGPNLPVFSQPLNCVKLLITLWHLKKPWVTLFLLMFNFCRSKPGTLSVVNSHVVLCVTRDALIMGIQSSWDYTEHMEMNSLIQHSDPDDKSVQRALGSLLCLGSNTDETVKGLVFENFQGGYYGWNWQVADERHEEISGADSMATFKGDLFLPNEVQVETIILNDQEGMRRVFWKKGLEPALHVHVEQKRNFTT